MKKIENYLKTSFRVHPHIFGIDDAIIAGVVALIGTAVSASVSSSNASKQADATSATNIKNMALNQQELGIQKEQADTQKITAVSDAQSKGLTDFMKKIKGTDLTDRIYGIWSGKA